MRVTLARVSLTLGSLAALAAVALIWFARASIPRPIYVSELGAPGMPTAPAFVVALLLIAAAAAVIAVAGRHPASRMPLVGAASVGATIALSSLCFIVASQVGCTAGCPVPVIDPASTMQDFVHTVAAVLGFVAGCAAMLQLGLVARRSVVSQISLAACACVGAITIVGGLLSIVGVASAVGGVLEFVGTTVAVGWLAGYGLWLAYARPVARMVSN